MKLNSENEMHRANKKGVLDKISNNSPDITYQEWVLFWCLRIAGPFVDVDMDETYAKMDKNDWINEKWLKTPASKINKMEITLPWDKVFD